MATRAPESSISLILTPRLRWEGPSDRGFNRPRDGESPRSDGNRLATEQSPYLLQHAGNPVDWWPWGEPAFDEARAARQPIFLSIGYATCHWCHVMEHESFEDRGDRGVLNATSCR